MVLVDTNILISLWIENAWTSDARSLLERDNDWRTEGFALIEFGNVMATYVREGLVTAQDALARLEEAQTLLGPGMIHVNHRQALAVAIAYRVSAYDARFLAAAQDLSIKLVTEDTKLRRAAPTLTQSLQQALEA